MSLPRHHPGHDVVVAPEVFGGAMHDQVDAEIEWVLVVRRGKGAVDHGA